MDALQILVRRFETRSLGVQIVSALEELGFRVRFMCSGESDTQGGLIETEIDFVDSLYTDDVKEIAEAISIEPHVLVHYRTFLFDEEGEIVGGRKIEPEYVSEYRLTNEDGEVVAIGTKDARTLPWTSLQSQQHHLLLLT